MAFIPNLSSLPAPQLALWEELGATPAKFTLYGGTALALRLGHRTSVDFDFFSAEGFDPDELASTIPYLRGAEKIQVAPNTLTCRVERGGAVLVSFFGALELGQVSLPEQAQGNSLNVASLRDIAGTKAAVVQKRAEAKDYLDIDALLSFGIGLAEILDSAAVVYGSAFNPLITLKALSYFGDLPGLPHEVRDRLSRAVEALDISSLPTLRRSGA